MSTRIEFRCETEEREQVKKNAVKAGLSVGKYLLKQSIYKRERSSLKANERASLCRIRTYLNKISDGIQEKECLDEVLKECESLCQSLK